MPSHADRVRRHYQESDASGVAVEPDGPLARALFDLSRYAGWLHRDQQSAAVLFSVRALDAAIAAGHDSSQALATLDADIMRLRSGDIRRMLRTAAGQIRAAIATDHAPARAGEGS